jgi:hypothetical protein
MGHGLATIEPIYAGDWVLWVRTPAHAIARQMMHVDEGTAETAFTVRVGRPAILSGRVEFDGISPVRSVCLLFLIGDGDRPGGNDWRGGSLLDSYIRVQPDGSFRLENVTPGHWVVTLRNEGLLAKKTVEVPSGSETQIVLHPIPGAQLDFRTTAPSPGDAVQFCIAEGDEVEWRNAMRLGAMKGKDVAYTETVQPGRVRWKVEFPVDNRLGASAAAATQEGELRVSAGEEIEVLVPVVPKK